MSFIISSVFLCTLWLDPSAAQVSVHAVSARNGIHGLGSDEYSVREVMVPMRELYDRSPQFFADIYHVEESQFEKATHRIIHQSGAASMLSPPVYRAADAP